MGASRHAQWLFISTLALGLAHGPVTEVSAHGLGLADDAAPSEPPRTEDKDAEPREGSGSESQGGSGSADADADADGPDGATAPEAEPAAPGEPTSDGGSATGDGGPKDPAAAEGGEVSSDGGESGAKGPGNAAEPVAGEAKVDETKTDEPRSEVITMRPGPVRSLSAEGEPTGELPAREAVVDPRRRFSDERIIVRASFLAFGVAGLALVPTIVGGQQGAYARSVLDRLDTPSEADARAEVQSYERSMNSLAIIGGAISATALISGAVLLSAGLRGRRADRKTAVAPAVGSGTAGLVVRGRF